MHQRLLKLMVVLMAAGVAFLLSAVGLAAWHYLVAPVPRPLVIGVVVLGFLFATALVTLSVFYALSERRPDRGR